MTYQAASGAGAPQMREMIEQMGQLHAAARDLLMRHVHNIPPSRLTSDVDFAFMVADWPAFDALRASMIESGQFEVRPANHRFRHRESGFPVDIVPFGDVERPDRTIAWPPDDSTIFDCFGCNSLNKMITAKNSGIMDFTSINSMLGHLNKILNFNATEDMILMCGDTPIVVNVNNNFFMNNNAYKFDKVDCPCTVFGKVINIAPRGQCISLLRKTAQTEYYEKILNTCYGYCDILDSNGIAMPKRPRLKCEGISLVVIPISICM
jgi:hypothetical protein